MLWGVMWVKLGCEVFLKKIRRQTSEVVFPSASPGRSSIILKKRSLPDLGNLGSRL